MIAIFSIESILCRGPNDNIQLVLLSDNAHPGQEFLAVARFVGGDPIQSEFVQGTLTTEPPLDGLVKNRVNSLGMAGQFQRR